MAENEAVAGEEAVIVDTILWGCFSAGCCYLRCLGCVALSWETAHRCLAGES